MLSVVLVVSALTFLPENQQVLPPFIEISLGHAEPAVAVIKKKQVQPVNKNSLPRHKASGIPAITREVKDSIENINPDMGINTLVGLEDGIGGYEKGDPGIEAPGEPAVEKLPDVLVDVMDPMSNPDIMPEFPGGLKSLVKFLE